MRATLARLPGRSDAAAAIRYVLARGDGLTRYLDDGRLEISNNAAERAILNGLSSRPRPRKNSRAL